MKAEFDAVSVNETWCLVVRGVDYNESYSPVLRYIITIRHLLALAAQLNLIVYQIAIWTVRMEQPEGLPTEEEP